MVDVGVDGPHLGVVVPVDRHRHRRCRPRSGSLGASRLRGHCTGPGPRGTTPTPPPHLSAAGLPGPGLDGDSVPVVPARRADHLERGGRHDQRRAPGRHRRGDRGVRSRCSQPLSSRRSPGRLHRYRTGLGRFALRGRWGGPAGNLDAHRRGAVLRRRGQCRSTTATRPRFAAGDPARPDLRRALDPARRTQRIRAQRYHRRGIRLAVDPRCDRHRGGLRALRPAPGPDRAGAGHDRHLLHPGGRSGARCAGAL